VTVSALNVIFLAWGVEVIKLGFADLVTAALMMAPHALCALRCHIRQLQEILIVLHVMHMDALILRQALLVSVVRATPAAMMV
jgi:hypothetical protein